jgi:hypothetical protein
MTGVELGRKALLTRRYGCSRVAMVGDVRHRRQMAGAISAETWWPAARRGEVGGGAVGLRNSGSMGPGTGTPGRANRGDRSRAPT